MGSVGPEDPRIHPRHQAQIQRDLSSDRRHCAHHLAAENADSTSTTDTPSGRDRNQQDGDCVKLPQGVEYRSDGEGIIIIMPF